MKKEMRAMRAWRWVRGMLWFAGSGAVAGVCMNVALGGAIWGMEGLTGGIVSGILIYSIS